MSFFKQQSENFEEPACDPASTSLGDLAWNIAIVIFITCISLVPPERVGWTSVDLQLAQTGQGAAVENKEQAVRITIDAAGNLTLDGVMIGSASDAATSLPAALRTAVKNWRLPPEVWIVPDRRTGFQDVVRVSAAIREVTGKFTFVAENLEVIP